MSLDLLLELNRTIHVTLGFAGLAAWWVPILTKKGGRHHRLFGKVFAVCAYFIGASAVLSVGTRLTRAVVTGAELTEDRATFGFLLLLGYLGFLALTTTHQAVQAVRTRRDPDTIRTPLLLALTVATMLGSLVTLGYALLWWSSISPVMLGIGPIGLFVGHGVWRYAYRRPPEKMAWFYEHMGAMLGSGIAFHTAFLVFGSRAVFDLSILGAFNWVPWVLPTAVGLIGGGIWGRHYRRKFGDLPKGGSVAGV